MTSRIRGRGDREEGCIEQASQIEQFTSKSIPSEPRQTLNLMYCCFVNGILAFSERRPQNAFLITNEMMQKFTLKEDPCIEEAIYQQLNRQYRDHRHRPHKNYYCKYAIDEIRLQNCPPDVSPNGWATLIGYFGYVDFKECTLKLCCCLGLLNFRYEDFNIVRH
ncbi:unnamed protein product [Ilex paraguariensis]|uniref:Uncharacterized protein n=1 Tax=Ilex paraguariensis TaxID=185542 RepID=A0ABC8T940_9AQUA